MSVAEFLDYLYYDIGRQSTPTLRLCRTWKDSRGEIRFSKWKYFLDIAGRSEVETMNQRSLMNNEVVIDVDKGDYDDLITQLIIDGYRFIAWKTAEHRAKHIHLFFDELIILSRQKREALRSWIIKKYGGDTQLASDSHMIPIEMCPHWKTGDVKSVYKISEK